MCELCEERVLSICPRICTRHTLPGSRSTAMQQLERGAAEREEGRRLRLAAQESKAIVWQATVETDRPEADMTLYTNAFLI